MKKNYEFISYLRVISMFLVAFPHLGVIIEPSWKVAAFIDSAINTPFAIIQNFGALGVCVFFVISGFLLYSNTDTPLKFVGKKMASIVLRLWVYMACFFLVVKISTAWGYSSWWTQFTTEDWLNSATLKNYLFGYSDSVNGVLWYLFTLLLSFALYIPFSAFTERKRIAPVYVLFSDIAIVIMTLFGTFPGLKLLSPYIGIFLTGFIIAMMFNREQGDGSLRTSVVLLMVNIAVTVFAFRETYYDTYYSTQPYLVSVVYAVLVFVICLQCADKFKKNPVITFLSNISYPFYVQHSLYGGFIIGYLYFMNIFPYTVLFLLGVGGSIVTASLSIYVESKVHNVFAKSLKKEGKKNYE